MTLDFSFFLNIPGKKEMHCHFDKSEFGIEGSKVPIMEQSKEKQIEPALVLD